MNKSREGQLYRAIVFLGLMVLLSQSGFLSEGSKESQELNEARLPQEELKVGLETFVAKDGVHPGETFAVAVVAHIAENWHIHGPDPDLILLIPAKMIFEDMDKIKILETYYPEAELKKYDYWDEKLEVYLGDVTFGILVEIAGDMPLGDQKIEGSFKYQACDDTSCRPPRTIPFEASFKVVAESAEANAIHSEVFSRIHFKSKDSS